MFLLRIRQIFSQKLRAGDSNPKLQVVVKRHADLFRHLVRKHGVLVQKISGDGISNGSSSCQVMAPAVEAAAPAVEAAAAAAEAQQLRVNDIRQLLQDLGCMLTCFSRTPPQSAAHDLISQRMRGIMTVMEVPSATGV